MRWPRLRRWYLVAPVGVTVGPFRSRQAAIHFRDRRAYNMGDYTPEKR